MNKITSYGVISQIYILAQNPEVGLVSRSFYEYSTLDSVRVDFLIKKFGKTSILKIENHDFKYCSRLFVREGLVLKLLEKECQYDTETPTTSNNRTKYYVPEIDINQNEGKLLGLAVRYRRTKIIKQILKAHKIKPDIKLHKSERKIILHPKAFMVGLFSKGLCDMLEEEGPDLMELFSTNGMKKYTYDCILYEFCKRENTNYVKLIIEKGADVHAFNNLSLRLSCEKGNLEIVKHLVENGADIHAKDNDSLKFATKFGNLDVFKYLVEKGANIHAKNEDAFKKGYFYLVKSGVDICSFGYDLLKNACAEGHLGIFKYLIQNSIDIHENNDKALRMANIRFNTDDFLKIASRNGNFHVIKYLNKNGANIASIGNKNPSNNDLNRLSDIFNYIRVYSTTSSHKNRTTGYASNSNTNFNGDIHELNQSTHY
ncbi:hypothetical protein BB558_005186 [Smittium angustum]|uniref:Uncharacterized protein n=1 Tax=Smittium angustum TaxID=133377 RepID=A0A2U1J158_SMIAN|nr:hypothetical protein BB558_005186 [Smittium angustum]